LYLGDAEPSDAWKLYRRSTDIQSEHTTKEIQFNAFDPADREPQIASERNEQTGP
jgi:hypothetical protein